MTLLGERSTMLETERRPIQVGRTGDAPRAMTIHGSPGGFDPEAAGVIFDQVLPPGRVQAANQREAVINQNGRPEAVSWCLCRSAVWGASIWGTEGREFNLPNPTNKYPV